MSYAAGVDVGSTQTKAVIMDENRHIIGRSLGRRGERRAGCRSRISGGAGRKAA